MTLYRAVGSEELELIELSGWKTFPPRMPEQPFFYPVLHEEYATQIAREWNVQHAGSGYVTRFEVDSAYAEKFPVRTVGSRKHQELWVPADTLEEFNHHIVGVIEVIAEYGPEGKVNQQNRSNTH